MNNFENDVVRIDIALNEKFKKPEIAYEILVNPESEEIDAKVESCSNSITYFYVIYTTDNVFRGYEENMQIGENKIRIFTYYTHECQLNPLKNLIKNTMDMLGGVQCE